METLQTNDPQGQDECGIYPNPPLQTSSDNILIVQPAASFKTDPDYEVYQSDSNIIPHFPPRVKEFSTEEQRLKTFKDRLWPIGLNQKPETLSKAGFYYRGKLLMGVKDTAYKSVYVEYGFTVMEELDYFIFYLRNRCK